MTQIKTTRIEVDRVVPDFSLPSLDGRHVGPAHFKQRANLVIAYLDLDRCGECIDLVNTFAGNHSQYRDLETQILVVGPQTPEELFGKLGNMGLPFPVLSDQERSMARAYFGDEERTPAAAIFVTDRYGALRTLILADSAAELPDESGIRDWLSLLEMECPECGD